VSLFCHRRTVAQEQPQPSIERTDLKRFQELIHGDSERSEIAAQSVLLFNDTYD
jgi:hypothetical protein